MHLREVILPQMDNLQKHAGKLEEAPVLIIVKQDEMVKIALLSQK